MNNRHNHAFVILLLSTIIFNSCLKLEFGEPGVVGSGLDKNKMLDLINQLRAAGCKCGFTNMPKVQLLKWNDSLEAVALNHSTDMSQKKYFSHINKENLDPGDRLDKFQFLWSAFGENIAKGQSTEEQVMDSWRKSTGHCKNMMNANFTLVGVARVNNYWTQVFATRRN